MANTLPNIDLKPFMAKLALTGEAKYRIKKEAIINGTFTLEDVILVGLRFIEREREWYAKHSTEGVKAKLSKATAIMAKLKAGEELTEEEVAVYNALTAKE